MAYVVKTREKLEEKDIISTFCALDVPTKALKEELTKERK